MPHYLTIAAYTDPLQAHIVRGRLECEGIAVTVADEHTALVYWHWRQALGGIKLRVPAAQFAQACAIVRELEAGGYALEEADITPPPCRETASSRIAYVVLFWLGLPLPWSRASARGD